ncbi:MAG: 3,4-dioxygenase subunit beta [Microbacterium sp. 71-36]|uniref:dioxygenase family protein n=1 Tax=unclassified Microbacterium TaxID=2609290 RepID=UPI00086A1F29|nr:MULTISPECIES: 3,4-dioxygenase subunit beta [unclassified Microbacterium]MBN9211810.1 3,4-dioxygenase subunit beta [Microbacterium sp.]ODT37674.1 MAG: 3,4-dioxygenase subunit beta [Microbacterium sp. SCN 71-17]OJV77660.1 MAG: 3,4-dioxygenase subunit beta [Microbacterium sp. 71-36]
MTRIPEPDQTPLGPAYEGRLLDRPDDEVVDQGASFDMRTLVSRRNVLGIVGLGAGAVALAACTPQTAASTTSTATATATPTASATASATPTATSAAAAYASEEIPQETNGPYPADGTNGVDVLNQSGIVRSDIRSSLDGGATAEGVPLTFTFTLSDLANGNAAYAGAAVYVWHCDANGLYSMYSDAVVDETYLRGIQVADAQGQVTFTTIVPGCYSGRWTHIHFEVYPDAASATNVSNQIATSQVAFPQDMLDAVYALDTYPDSARNLAQIGSLSNDNVFSDGWDLEMGTFTGDPSTGYVGSLAVAIDATTAATVSGGGGPSRP